MTFGDLQGELYLLATNYLDERGRMSRLARWIGPRTNKQNSISQSAKGEAAYIGPTRYL